MATKPDTSDYSATKSPETRTPAEERDSTFDHRLMPGGAMGSPSLQGMAALEDVPADADGTGHRQARATGHPEEK